MDNVDIKTPSAIKPIKLYDHLPGILAGYPAVLFLIFGLLSWPFWDKTIGMPDADGKTHEVIEQVGLVDPHMLFWIGLTVMILWYIAFAFNLPKNKFLLVFGLVGTFVGIPVALELTGLIRPFSWLGRVLQGFAPELNTGGWFLMGLSFGGIWLGNFLYSRTHMRVKIDESGLTLNQIGGKGERFELIGLKTENEPIDYLELFLAGVGSLSLKTRMNKPIFKMRRVIGLYRTWWWPFKQSKLARIEEILSYQGKVLSVDHQDRVDAADMADMDGEIVGDEEALGEEEHNAEDSGPGHDTTDEHRGEIS